MNKLLSICIPTFNREQELDKQLNWLAQEIKDFENECEIIISDNCSTDSTQEVIQKWKPAFSKTTFKSNRNSENIGWMKNFSYCLNTSTSKYIWIIGDDDLIYNGALAYVLKNLKEKPDLTLLYLNFCDRNKETNEVLAEHWFDTNLEKDISNGKAIFQHCLEKNIGSVIFITATICRTDLAQKSLQSWPDCLNNWAGLAYWNGFCASYGSVLVTKDNYLECTVGNSAWQKDPRAWFKIRHADIPEIYVKLQQIGYPQSFCRRMILNILREDIAGNEAIGNIKYGLWCFMTSPFSTMRVLQSFLASIIASIKGNALKQI